MLPDGCNIMIAPSVIIQCPFVYHLLAAHRTRRQTSGYVLGFPTPANLWKCMVWVTLSDMSSQRKIRLEPLMTKQTKLWAQMG